MTMHTTLLRGAAIMAIAATIIGTTVTVSAPTAEASVLEKKTEKSSRADSGSGISDVPIIGDLVGSFEGQEPEEIAVGAIQLTAGAAEIAVPMIIRLFK